MIVFVLWVRCRGGGSLKLGSWGRLVYSGVDTQAGQFLLDLAGLINELFEGVDVWIVN